MVRQSAEAKRKAVASAKNRDDKRWKRVLAKMSAEKKKTYTSVGGSRAKTSVRGATRASQRKLTGRKSDKVAYETTIHVAKLIKGQKFASRAPRAVAKIRSVAAKLMKTKDNRIDASLNTLLWSRGVKGVPRRVRVVITRKVAEATETSGKRKHLYTVISAAPVPESGFKGLTTKAVAAA
jgi:large subunit ribosomal protein L31e